MRFPLLLAALACTATAWASPIVREPGAIYLSDYDVPAVKLALKQATPSSFGPDGRRYAGTLRFPQVVKLDAIYPEGKMLRVRGNAQQGGVAAWIPEAAVQNLPENFVTDLKRLAERAKQVNDLIARGEVAIGMTPEEVAKSLGPPQKKTSFTGREEATQVFEYVKYKLVPQTVFTPGYAQTIVGYTPEPGKPLQTVVVQNSYGVATVYVKVPVGSCKVSFRNGIVESIEESSGTTAGARPSIVVPPIEVGW